MVAFAALHVLVEQVEAEIRRGAVHPLDVNVTGVKVEVVGEELVLGRLRLPVELLCDLAPKLRRVLYRSADGEEKERES